MVFASEKMGRGELFDLFTTDTTLADNILCLFPSRNVSHVHIPLEPGTYMHHFRDLHEGVLLELLSKLDPLLINDDYMYKVVRADPNKHPKPITIAERDGLYLYSINR
jgi:hypothetical protein